MTLALVVALSTIRNHGRYCGRTFGAILLEARNPTVFFQYVVRHEDGEQALAAAVLLDELHRHDRFLSLACSYDRPLDAAA